MDDKKFNLLKEIDKQGSLTKATKTINVSYRTGLNYITKIESTLDISVVDTRKGGKGGGGSTYLTNEGKKILKRCNIINAIMELHRDLNEIETIVSSIDTNEGVMTINFNSSEITMPLNKSFIVGDRILALISYDNVFIMNEAYKSSVRNIFKGSVTGMSLYEDMFRIKVDLGNIEICSDITKAASDDIDLKLGKTVYIGFKAMSIATLKL
jgi:molybdate transport system regulatory protein